MTDVHKETRLEKIARNITNPKSKWARAGWFIPAVYFGGSAAARYQKPFAKAIGVKEHVLTLCSAVIFGIGGAALYYYGGQEASRGVEHVARELSQPTRVVAELYAAYTLAHSFGRIVYSLKTKKAIGSPCPIGLISTASCASAEFTLEAFDKIKNGNSVKK